MTDITVRLHDAVRDVMSHQWSHSRPAMHALTELVDAAEAAAFELDRLRRDNNNLRAHIHTCGPHCRQAGCVNERLRAALAMIATPRRPDGTYNRDRAACEALARAALGE